MGVELVALVDGDGAARALGRFLDVARVAAAAGGQAGEYTCGDRGGASRADEYPSEYPLGGEAQLNIDRFVLVAGEHDVTRRYLAPVCRYHDAVRAARHRQGAHPPFAHHPAVHQDVVSVAGIDGEAGGLLV